MWDRRATVSRVIDGDTVEAVLDQGYGDTKRIHVRLSKARAPERGQPGYKETAEYLERWLLERMRSLTWPYVIVTQRLSSDVEDMTFNRYVGVLWDSTETENASDAVNAFVLDNGYPPGRGVHRPISTRSFRDE